MKSIILFADPSNLEFLVQEARLAGGVDVIAVHSAAKLVEVPGHVLQSARLISFLVEKPIPAEFLRRLGFGAYHFHPGPPRRPGFAALNFALFEGASAFGSTLHRWTSEATPGDIISVDLFSIPDACRAGELEQLSTQSALRLFKASIAGLTGISSELDAIPVSWDCRQHTEEDLRGYLRVGADIDAAELERRVRAFHGSNPAVRVELETADGIFVCLDSEVRLPAAPEPRNLRTLHGKRFLRKDHGIDLRTIADETWFEMLLRSTSSSVVDGIAFPGFPSDEIQANWVGSSNEQALREAFTFYRLLKAQSVADGRPFTDTTRVLDFGCGWGRFLRIFRKDIAPGNLYGVDINEMILAECRRTNVDADLGRIFNGGKLPFPDNYFDCVIAYSVFTHLPESAHHHWLDEIARVSRKDCLFVLTLESARFLDFVQGLARSEPATLWHGLLREHAHAVPALRDAFGRGEFVYLPTGGGPSLPPEFYGDAVVPLGYVKRRWAGKFHAVDYIDDASRFWQAVLVTRRD